MNPERNGPFKPLFNSLSLASQARPGIAEASIFRGLMSLNLAGVGNIVSIVLPLCGMENLGLLPADDLNGWVILYKSLNMVYKKGSFGISFFGSSVYNCGGCWTGLYRVEHWAVIVTWDVKDTFHDRVRNVFAPSLVCMINDS
jgi:hypothetical protein